MEHTSHLQPLITIISTVSAGIFCLILSERIKLPSIIFLLLTGIGLGPYGLNIIQPSVFKDQLPQFITLLVALILFEGGTSLKFKQLKGISTALRQILSVGVIITLAIACAGAHLILGMPWMKAILFGSVLIVTGPTVVQPILQRIRVKEKIHNILKWESILIDPLGVIIAIVLSEILLIDYIGPLQGLGLLGARILLGVFLGFLAGKLMEFFLSKPYLLRFESEELSGIFVLAINLLFYGISEAVLSESGMVTVTVAGILFGNSSLANVETILRFKKQLTLVALSMIFILLSALVPLPKIYGIVPEGTLFLFFLIFIVRPLSILISTARDSSLTHKEKLFISFFAPRGIVSAVLASLLTILFEEKDFVGKGTFLPLAFYVIMGSIIFYTITGRLFAKALDLVEEEGKNILIIGASPNAIILAKALRLSGFKVIFIDTNTDLCRKIRSLGFTIYNGSGTNKDFLESLDLKGIHQMIAATPNHEANVLSCQLMSHYLGKKVIYRLWDKEDSWGSFNTSLQEQWGRPIVLSNDDAFTGSKEIIKETLNKTAIVSEAFINTLNLTPLYAVFQNSLILLSPQTTLPSGTEIFGISKKQVSESK